MPDFSHEYPGHDDHEFITTNDGFIEIRITKVGGGTVGRHYSGYWHYAILRHGLVLRHGSDLYTGTDTTHLGAALIVTEFLP